MTRVEKINKAIEILHTTKNMDARQITQYLGERGIHIELPVVAGVISGLNFVKPPTLTIPRKSKLQIKIERLVEALKPVMVTHRHTRAPWRYLASVLNSLDITVPGSGVQFNNTNLCKFLRQHNLHVRSSAGKFPALTYAAYCAKIEPVIGPLEQYAAWIQEGN